MRTVPSVTPRQPGDLGVGVPRGGQAQQFPVPGSQRQGAVAAALGIQMSLVQVRTQG
jgi:hypothetical protein